MKIKNLNHKINRKAMVKRYMAYMEEELGAVKEFYWEKVENYGMYAADYEEDNMRIALAQQEELYAELVATPVGGETPRDILVDF